MADLYAVAKYRTTANGALAYTVNPGADAQLLSVTARWNVAPTTSENFTITVNYPEGGEYSTLLLSEDPSVGSVTNLFYQPDARLILASGDTLTIAYTNTDTRFIAVQVRTEEEDV
ncbi:MAG: hypothetical protein ACYS21_05490 [Planctomycetota bacterium]|jgi:hypothetical protein